MSEAQLCIRCRKHREPHFFLPHPPRGFHDICTECLPPAQRGVKRCRNCRLRMRTEEFGRTSSNLLSGVCRHCFDHTKVRYACARCKKEKKRTEFDCLVTLGGQKKRRRSCRECFKPPPTSAQCNKCNGTFSIESFPRRASGRRSKACEECYSPTGDYLRRCLRCNKSKPKTEFRQLLDARLAKVCNSCPIRNPQSGGRRIRKLPRPCQFCKVEMWSAKPYEKTLDVQFCSSACRNLSKLNTPERCLQCGEKKEHSEFPRRFGNGIHHRRCYACVERMRTNREVKARGDGSMKVIRSSIKKRANALNAASDLAYLDVEKLMDAGCFLCGNPAQCVTFTHEKALPSKANTKGCCYSCRAIQGRRSLDEIIGWAALVARVHSSAEPASPKPIAVGRKNLRPAVLEEQREEKRDEQTDVASHAPLRKQKLKSYDLVPKHVHQGRQMGESFEEMLARFQRPAKVGRKRPKEKQDAT